MSETDVIIYTANLKKQIKSRILIDDINLQVEFGDIYGLIGSNGSGKSVLLKILATIIKPSAGIVRIFDQDISKKPQKIRSLIGYMPDNSSSFSDLKIREYLDFFASAYKIPKKEHQNVVNDVLELMDLSSSSDCKINTLSLGTRKRISIARTLIHDPSLLILDDPICFLDPKVRIEIKEIIKELANMGKTIIIASNTLADLASICNKIGIMKDGRLIFSGSIDRILSQIGESLTIEIRVYDNVELAKEILQSQKEIGTIDIKGNIIKAQFNGNREDIYKILAILVNKGIKVCSFREQSLTLEDIYLKTCLYDLR
ncbi:MAG: ABC transporter ATP-binding protein [Candidatus Poribacteria bacterium]